MKGEFYKMDFRAWNVGTVDLTLEQEAAYLRLCHAMYDVGGPVPNSTRMLMGLFRCGNVKAQALLSALVKAGKIAVTSDDRLINHRVTEELASREKVSAARRIAGEKGGSATREKGGHEGGESRVTAEWMSSDPRVTPECSPSDKRVKHDKSLKNNDHTEAIAPTPRSRGEEIREEKNSLRSLEIIRAHEWPPDYRERAWDLYGKKVDKPESMAALEKLYRSDTVSWTMLTGGFENQKRAVPEPKFRPSLERYIKRGKWTDEAPIEEPGHGQRSSDLFARFPAGRGSARPVQSPAAAAVARHANRERLRSGQGQDDPRPGDEGYRRPSRDDPEIPDAEWSPASSYSRAH